MKAFLKLLLDRIIFRYDLRLYSVRAHGREDVNDLRRTGHTFAVIFDVGANIGQSVLKFRRAFTETVIHSFEPVTVAYNQLKANVGGMPGVYVHPLAFGNETGRRAIFISSRETEHSMVRSSNTTGKELVAIDTIDHFCDVHRIDHIDLLKIDVEGFDMEVLRGAAAILGEGSVEFILVECGFVPDDVRHTYFETVRSFVHPYGYRLFGIYEQQLEFSGELRIRFANACFCLQPDLRTRCATREGGCTSVNVPAALEPRPFTGQPSGKS